MREITSPAGIFVAIYGLAHGCKSLVWHASEFLFLFFLTEAVGLSQTAVASIFGASLALNAAMDVVVGWRLGSMITTNLAASRLQALGAVMVGAWLITFAASGQMAAPVRLPFALVSIIGLRLSYPLFDNPQNTMLALASGDGGRTKLAATRYFTGAGAKLMLASTFAPMMIGQPMQVQSLRFLWLAIVIAALAATSALALHMVVRRHPALKITGLSVDAGAHPDAAGAYLSIVALCFVAIVLSASTAMFGRLEPYFAAFAVRDIGNAASILSSVAIGAMASQVAWAMIARRCPVISVLRLALVIMAAGSVGFGAFANHDPAAAAACGFVYGVGSGGTMMAVWSLIAALAAQPHVRHAPTLIFGLYTGFSKSGLVIATVIVGTVLSLLDYRASATAAGPILWMMSTAPLVGALIIGAVTIIDRRRAVVRAIAGAAPAASALPRAQ